MMAPPRFPAPPYESFSFIFLSRPIPTATLMKE
jgi:hypothetical protein